MKRVYKHRYKVLSGQFAGQVFDGQEIGYQDYPEQFDEMREEISQDLIGPHIVSKQSRGRGIWLDSIKQALYRNPNREREVTIDETINYQGLYEDLCIPFDRNNNEIHVGDVLYVASSNEVRLVKVTKIAANVYRASYGVMQRKLTVRDELEGQTLTISDSRATMKAPNV
jgi:hypothetical protein